jgi:hypothetical protein
MWWEPRSPEESELWERARSLVDRYRGHLADTHGEPPIARGVGAGAPLVGDAAGPGTRPGTAAFGQYWRPLVLVDDRTLPPLPPGVTRTEFGALDRESAAFDVLAGWDLDEDVLIEPVGPVIPAVQPGAEVQSPRGTATVGLPVASDLPVPNSHGFLTIAHGVGAVGSAVTVTTPGGPVTGEVQWADESAGQKVGTGGDDIALVALDPPAQLTGWLPNSGTMTPPAGPPYPTLPVDLFASQSGGVIAQVTGALLQLGDQTWQWLDCWELGVTQPLMQRGDSGSVAIEPTGVPRVLGHFVGGSAALRGVGFTHHWVQDLGQVLARHNALDSVIRY